MNTVTTIPIVQKFEDLVSKTNPMLSNVKLEVIQVDHIDSSTVIGIQYYWHEKKNKFVPSSYLGDFVPKEEFALCIINSKLSICHLKHNDWKTEKIKKGIERAKSLIPSIEEWLSDFGLNFSNVEFEFNVCSVKFKENFKKEKANTRLVRSRLNASISTQDIICWIPENKILDETYECLFFFQQEFNLEGEQIKRTKVFIYDRPVLVKSHLIEKEEVRKMNKIIPSLLYEAKKASEDDLYNHLSMEDDIIVFDSLKNEYMYINYNQLLETDYKDDIYFVPDLIDPVLYIATREQLVEVAIKINSSFEEVNLTPVE